VHFLENSLAKQRMARVMPHNYEQVAPKLPSDAPTTAAPAELVEQSCPKVSYRWPTTIVMNRASSAHRSHPTAKDGADDAARLDVRHEVEHAPKIRARAARPRTGYTSCTILLHSAALCLTGPSPPPLKSV
jgi:hypothetical protein